MKKFDAIVQGSFDIANKVALERKNPIITEAHFLYGLICNPQSTASRYLQEDKKLLEGLLDTLSTVENVSIETQEISPRFQEWVSLASSEAVQSKREVIAEVDFLKHLQRFFPQIQIVPEAGEPAEEKPTFLIDLNDLAQKGKLDPVIGRSSEILKVQEILCRRTKNNPVLVGLPGVGKTAIVEGLAGLIEGNYVPDTIQGKTIYSLNMGMLVANTKYRGEFEEKIENLLKFLKSKGGESILFIDELHLLIGSQAGGAMDAANLLKPALARGELHCIGATTYEEYKKYIESDSALERRFHKVQVHEPTREESIQILSGLREKLEIHHGIEITDAAIVAAVNFSDQYITERFLPDKALDVLDEASASLKLSAESLPPEIQELESLIRSKKMLQKTSSGDKKNLADEIHEAEKKCEVLKKKWNEKNIQIKSLTHYKKELEEAKIQLQKHETDGNLDAAAKIKHGIIPEMQKKIQDHDVYWKLDRKKIAETISRNIGIPIERILQTRQENLLKLEKHLQSRILGQEEALKEITEILLASHSGLSDESRPLGSFLILGPSGVGKTETSKAIAYYLFNGEKYIVRIDLSEYRESHSVAKLIGAAPGYIGYEKGGILTEAVRRMPYCVILFDEIEKAHPDFSDILLQILDDSRLTDTQGRVVNFKNTVIFITSNLPNHEKYLKPEIIGRIDAIFYYKHLTRETMYKLVMQELQSLNNKLSGHGLYVELDEATIEKIITSGFDEKYGARPLKNAFNRLIIRPISKKLLENENIASNNKIAIDEKNNIFLYQK